MQDVLSPPSGWPQVMSLFDKRMTNVLHVAPGHPQVTEYKVVELYLGAGYGVCSFDLSLRSVDGPQLINKHNLLDLSPGSVFSESISFASQGSDYVFHISPTSVKDSILSGLRCTPYS